MSPHLRIVKGDPSDEEVAALVAVVSALGSGAGSAAPERPRSAWSDRRALVREALPHGHGAWRASGLPR
jgi:acyl-CoA carboxylase epsilon subunit